MQLILDDSTNIELWVLSRENKGYDNHDDDDEEEEEEEGVLERFLSAIYTT